MISHTVPEDELPSLIGAILSGRRVANIVDHLPGSDTQAYIDAIDEVRRHSSFLRNLLICFTSGLLHSVV